MPADINSNYYIMQSYGGWSPCIQGNNAHGLRPFPGSVLPNCVGYIVGRFNEMLSEGACSWLASVDARDLLQAAINQGLDHGDDPRVGGVICWRSDDNGHAAIIEEVIDANTVRTSESGWNYTTPPVVKSFTRTRSGGSWTYGAGYTYQGIIYPPKTPGGSSDDYYILWLENEGLKI